MDLTVERVPVYAATGGQPFDAERPCVIFLHGAGCDHTSWTLPARYFAHHGWSVLAPDLPGHGRSGGSALAGIEAMVRWVEALMAAAGVAQAALIGHSMGGAIALEAAARLGARVTHLGLIGTAAAIPVGSVLLEAAKAAPEQAYDMMTGWCHSAGARTGSSPVPGLWMSGGTRAVFGRNAPGVLAADLAACAAWSTGPQAMARVACPTRVIIASEDVMTPAKRGRELAAGIAGAETTVIERSGHMIMTEAPDACLDALIALLAAAPAQAAAR
jgi:pimeloyl-ACP methyl ester carboxylesterase